MVDSGLPMPGSNGGEKWFTSRDIFERLETHARENVDSFASLTAHLGLVQADMAKLSHALELLALRLEPLAELRQHICSVEVKVDAAHRRLDDMEAQGQGRLGVSRTFLGVLSAVSTFIALWLGILHLVGR
jgi:hypothetical protein